MPARLHIPVSAPAPAGATTAGVVHNPARVRRLPWVALGVLLVSGAIVAFALFSITQAARTLVWVTAVDLPAGTTVERTHLQLVGIGADPGVALVSRGEEASILGGVTRGPIPAGTPLSPALVVAPGDSVPPGFAVVGADLEPGQYPSSRLAAGDRVALLVTAPPAGGDNRLEPATSLGEATIWDLDATVTASGALFVSMLVPGEQAYLVASAAEAERLRLALVNAGTSGAEGGSAGG